MSTGARIRWYQDDQSSYTLVAGDQGARLTGRRCNLVFNSALSCEVLITLPLLGYLETVWIMCKTHYYKLCAICDDDACLFFFYSLFFPKIPVTRKWGCGARKLAYLERIHERDVLTRWNPITRGTLIL